MPNPVLTGGLVNAARPKLAFPRPWCVKSDNSLRGRLRRRRRRPPLLRVAAIIKNVRSDGVLALRGSLLPLLACWLSFILAVHYGIDNRWRCWWLFGTVDPTRLRVYLPPWLRERHVFTHVDRTGTRVLPAQKCNTHTVCPELNLIRLPLGSRMVILIV